MKTPKREAFARHYAQTGNAAEAARLAGYSEHTARQQGSRLLTDVDVQAEIATLERVQREVEAVARGFVIAGLRDLALNAKTESNRVRAYELLGKTMRMFVSVSETTHTVDVPELAGIPLDELLALRETLVKALPEPIEVEVRVLDN